MILLTSLGAVISGRHFKNPVSLSKKIMYESSYCALSGDGALEFAREKNFPICKPEELIHTPGPTTDPNASDTVAAVAIDANGHLACATSTGTCRVAFVNICFLETWKPCNNVININEIRDHSHHKHKQPARQLQH